MTMYTINSNPSCFGDLVAHGMESKECRSCYLRLRCSGFGKGLDALRECYPDLNGMTDEDALIEIRRRELLEAEEYAEYRSQARELYEEECSAASYEEE